MGDVGMERATDRVALACKALSAATDDLRVAFSHYKLSAVEDAARMVEVETERVCELAEDLASLATNLRRLPALTADTRAATRGDKVTAAVDEG